MLAFALRGSEARNVDVTGPESRLGVFKRELESKSIPADGLSANGAADAGSGSAPNAFRMLSRKQPSADRVSGALTYCTFRTHRALAFPTAQCELVFVSMTN